MKRRPVLLRGAPHECARPASQPEFGRLRRGRRAGLVHLFADPGPGTRDAGLDRADRHVADHGRFLVGHPLRAHEHERLPQHHRQGPEQALQVAQFGFGLLMRGGGVLDRRGALQRAALAPAATRLLIERVAQNREQPRFQVRAGAELPKVAERAHEGILDEIVRGDAVPDQEPGETAQFRQYCRDLTMQGWRADMAHAAGIHY